MRQMIDGIVHSADVPALVAWFTENDPDKLNEDGTGIAGFDRTPTLLNDTAALTYVPASRKHHGLSLHSRRSAPVQ